MVIGLGTPIPNLANLPGPSRPGYPSGGGGTPFTNTYSMAFDGIDDYVDCGNGGTFSFGDGTTDSPFSVSAWVKMDDAARFRVFSKEDAGSAREWLFSTSSGRQLLLNLYSQNDSAIKIGRLTGVLTSYVGSWIHICGTYDGSSSSSGIKIYVNGVRSDTSDNNAGSYVAMQSNTGPFRIGSGFSYYANGNIDETSVFNYELSASDVTAIYNFPNGPNNLDDLSTPPAAWYRMGENGIWKSPQWLLPENSNKDKLSNYSFSFDGTGDEISLGSLEINTDEAWSVSFWANLASFGAYPGVFKLKTDESQGFACFFSNIGSYKGINFGANTLPFTNIKTDGDISASLVGAWNNVILTYNGSGKTTLSNYSIYVNGSSVTAVASGAYGSVTNVSVIGDVTQHFNGNIDEFAVFQGTELTALNAAAIHNGGEPTTLPVTPTAYYKMGEQANFTDNWLVNNSALSNYSTRSFNFDGIGDYIDIPSSATLSGQAVVSISAWIKPDTIAGASTNKRIFDESTSTSGYTRFGIERDADTIQLKWRDSSNDPSGSAGTLSTGSVLTVGVWTHILAIYNSTSNEQKIYINGSPSASSTTSISALGTSTTFGINIGRSSNNTNYYSGNIDEVAVWHSDQSANAGSIYSGGTPSDLTSLSPTNWWRMGEDATFNGSTNEFTVPDQSGSRVRMQLLMDLQMNLPFLIKVEVTLEQVLTRCY